MAKGVEAWKDRRRKHARVENLSGYNDARMGSHIESGVLELYALGRLAEPVLGRVKEHLLTCEACRQDVDSCDRGIGTRRGSLVPMSFVHETEDGPIYSHTTPGPGGGWVARHWGRELDGGRTCQTILDANEYLLVSFAEMFPEHECGPGCQILDVDGKTV